MSHLPFPQELFEQYAAEYQTKINKSQQELIQLRGQLSGKQPAFTTGLSFTLRLPWPVEYFAFLEFLGTNNNNSQAKGTEVDRAD